MSKFDWLKLLFKDRLEITAYVVALEKENDRLRNVLDWTNTWCPGRCRGVTHEALAKSNVNLHQFSGKKFISWEKLIKKGNKK